jgi:acyl-coenzyme A thioesterase PaaI-like protein
MIRRLRERLPHALDWRVFNIWPAIVGTGGRVTRVTEDWTELDVRLPLSWRTRNYVGTIFGGSIYAATDPYVMVMLIRQLGDDYVVWDKSARVSFKRPGTATLYAEFRIPPEKTAQIKATVDAQNKFDFVYSLDLKDAEGRVYATIDKTVYVARKDWVKEREARRAKRAGG